MTPTAFIAKWRAVELKERSASQSHFNDLCRLLDRPDPTTADPTGEWFTFEKGAAKSTGGQGWADVWRKHAFAWEYKGKHRDLDAAHAQLLRYAVALENPPLLIVSDMDRIVIRTNWTNTVQETHTLLLDDLLDGAKRDLLRAAFDDPERLKPTKTRDALTAEAAERFAALAQRLRARGHPPETVAHFVNRLVFCMFAEDTDLLPGKLFEAMLHAARPDPASFATHASTLFAAMRVRRPRRLHRASTGSTAACSTTTPPSAGRRPRRPDRGRQAELVPDRPARSSDRRDSIDARQPLRDCEEPDAAPARQHRMVRRHFRESTLATRSVR